MPGAKHRKPKRLTHSASAQSPLAHLSHEAAMHMAMGQLERAEAKFCHVLEQRQLALGFDHPLTVMSLHNLGRCLSALGNWDKAEIYHREAFMYRKRALGAKHPDTISSILSWAQCLGHLGRQNEASFAIPTLEHMGMQARKLLEACRYVEGEAMYRAVLEVYEPVMGDPDHHNLMTHISGLAGCLVHLDREPEAEPLLRQVLNQRIRDFGEEHSNSITAASNLGHCLIHMEGKLEEAESILKRALVVSGRTHGPRHQHTLKCMDALAGARLKLGKYAQASSLYTNVLRLKTDLLGEANEEVLNTQSNLASCMVEMGHVEDALELFDRTAELCRRVHGPYHPDTSEHEENAAFIRKLMEESGPEACVARARAASERNRRKS